MIITDKKRAITTIMARRSPRGEQLTPPIEIKPEHNPAEQLVDGRRLAAEEAMSALQDKSPDRLMEALSTFVDLHGLLTPTES